MQRWRHNIQSNVVYYYIQRKKSSSTILYFSLGRHRESNGVLWQQNSPHVARSSKRPKGLLSQVIDNKRRNQSLIGPADCAANAPDSTRHNKKKKVRQRATEQIYMKKSTSINLLFNQPNSYTLYINSQWCYQNQEASSSSYFIGSFIFLFFILKL